MGFNYLIKVSYDGTNFFGFQRQLNQRSIQEELEKAISRVNSQNYTSIKASGRTDAKVHAYMQICTFESEKKFSRDNFIYVINNLLPNDIYVYDLEIVADDFHPRYHAKSKKYRYRINLGEFNVFKANYELHLAKELDINKMISASKVLIGKHDFRTFSSALDSQDTIRTIYNIEFKYLNGILELEFHGSGFLRYMVRKLTSVLIDVGLNKIDERNLEDLLLAKNKASYSKIVKGHGLYLVEVKY